MRNGKGKWLRGGALVAELRSRAHPLEFFCVSHGNGDEFLDELAQPLGAAGDTEAGGFDEGDGVAVELTPHGEVAPGGSEPVLEAGDGGVG